MRLLLAVASPRIGSAIVGLPAIDRLLHYYGSDARVTIGYLRAAPVEPSVHAIISATVNCEHVLFIGGGLGPLLENWIHIVRRRYRAVIFLDLDPAGVSARTYWKYRIYFALAGVGRLVGLRPKLDTKRDAGGLPLHVSRLRLLWLKIHGIDIDGAPPSPALPSFPHGSIRTEVGQWLAARRTFPERPLIAISPGARAAANHWGEDRFAELGRRLVERGRCELVACGGAGEAGMGARLISNWGQGINAAGAFSLAETAALFRSCALHVGLDTGTTHLAKALGVPSIALLGGRNPAGLWDPLGPGVILRHPVSCAGCRLTECPVPKHPCMRAITVDEVLAEVECLCPASVRQVAT